MDSTVSGKVPVVACVRDAWRSAIAEARGVFPAAIVVAAAAAVSALVAQGGGVAVFGALAIELLAGAAFAAAVLRKVVRGERAGRFGVTFGEDEMRLIGVALSLLLLFVPLGLLVMIVIWITVVGKVVNSTADLSEFEALMGDPEALTARMAEALGPQGQTAFSLFVLIVCVIAIVLAARLVLVNAAAIGERRVVIFQTWSWSRGNVLRIIAAMLLTTIPAMLFGSVLVSIIQAPLAGGAVGALGLLVIAAASGLVSAYANLPAITLGAVLYRGLRPQDFVAK